MLEKNIPPSAAPIATAPIALQPFNLLVLLSHEQRIEQQLHLNDAEFGRNLDPSLALTLTSML